MLNAKNKAAGNQPAGADKPSVPGPVANKKAARKKAEEEKAAADATAAALPEVNAAAVQPEETKTVAAAKPPEKEAKPAETAMAKTATKPAAKPVKKKTPAAKDNPFAGLPETVDLPLSTETGDMKIADVTIDKRYLMGLELLAGPEICKHKFVYDLKRSATDKQLWDIRMQRRKRDDPLPVAQIQKTPTDLKFRWLPAAEKFDDANYIRNCKIKLSANKDTFWIGLRKPVDIQNFAFESGRTSVKADVDFKWLPNPEVVRVELNPFVAEERGNAQEDRHKGKVIFAPRDVLKKAPGVIFFREREELKFFFVEVGVDIRSKLKMQAQMFALGANGAPRPLKKPADILQLVNVLGGRKAEAETHQAWINQAPGKPEVVKKFAIYKDEKSLATIKAKVKKATDLATRQYEASGDYVKIIQNLEGLRIPFHVFFDMDGHRIKLAESIAQSLPKKAKK